MKKTIYFSLIGAFVIFFWQFLSYALINFHKSGAEYTPLQEEMLNYFDSIGLEQGMYLLGQPDPAIANEEGAMDQYMGGPWAVVNYQKEMSAEMIMPMVRGFLVSMVIAWLLFWLFNQQKDPSLRNRLCLAVVVGIIGFLFTPYTNFIWYKNPDIWAYFLDGIAPWVILGWIGHRMAR
jgi:hypothetical protein